MSRCFESCRYDSQIGALGQDFKVTGAEDDDVKARALACHALGFMFCALDSRVHSRIRAHQV